MSTTDPRRVIILGALSAMAEESARLLAGSGSSLSLFGRDAARLETIARDLRTRGAKVDVRVRDLCDTSHAVDDLRQASEAIGGADTVLLFYGLLGDQTRAEKDIEEARRIIDVNFTSAAEWLLAGANLLEASNAPRRALVGVSSVAGDRGRRSNYIYGAAKGGLSILLQGIAHRWSVTPGLRAVAVKAGFVDTPMTAEFKKGPLWAKPGQIAQVIVRAMDQGGAVIYAPWIWRWIMLLIRLMPEFVFKRLNL